MKILIVWAKCWTSDAYQVPVSTLPDRFNEESFVQTLNGFIDSLPANKRAEKLLDYLTLPKYQKQLKALLYFKTKMEKTQVADFMQLLETVCKEHDVYIAPILFDVVDIVELI